MVLRKLVGLVVLACTLIAPQAFAQFPVPAVKQAVIPAPSIESCVRGGLIAPLPMEAMLKCVHGTVVVPVLPGPPPTVVQPQGAGNCTTLTPQVTQWNPYIKLRLRLRPVPVP